MATRLGWDEARQTVDCDDTWWKDHLEVSQNMIVYCLW
jgi:hypothetical protein